MGITIDGFYHFMDCLMAAVNVAVTKTPVGTNIILRVLFGTGMLPVIAIASASSRRGSYARKINLLPIKRQSRSYQLSAISSKLQSNGVLDPN